ncbi:MAG: TolC family protein [Rhodospirillaceae bacterium]|nr:TolC family protein [Rhodospirillales bacterium]
MTIARSLPLRPLLCAVVLTTSAMLPFPLTAQTAEPPPPAAAPRAEVEQSGKPKKPAAEAPQQQPGPFSPDLIAAPAPTTTEAKEEALGERGAMRSALLVRLLGGQTTISLDALPDTPPDMVDPLRLDEVVAFAMKNNFEVKAARAKTDAADWDVVAAYGAYVPAITWSRSSGKERSRPASYSVNDVRVQDSGHHRRDRLFTLRQPIIDLTLISDILLRHKNQSAAEIDQLSTRERVALQTVGAFYKMIMARLSMRFAQDYKSQLDKLTELMGRRVEGGGAPQSDLDRIKTRTVSAQSAIIESRSEFSSAMDEFHRLTGITPLQLQVPASLVPTPPASRDDAMAKAMAANPDYLLSLKQADVQDMESAKSYSRLLPKVNFELTDSRSWNAGGAGLGTSTAGGGDEIFPYQNERRAMVTTSWALNAVDIPAGLASQAKAREATFRSMDTRNRIEESVRISYNALNAAQGRVVVLEQAIDSNAKVVAAFEEQYLNASRPLFDLLDAYERNYTARLDLTRLLIAEAQAGYQLRRQMGELVPALKESEPRANPTGSE